MKKMFIMVLCLVFASQVFALNYGAEFYRDNLQSALSGSKLDPIYLYMTEAGDILGAGGLLGTGDVFYVDSNVANEGDGKSWLGAKNTLAEAIALCTASNGDVIYVAQGHAETWSTAALSATQSKIGVSIVGCGSGTLKPTFTMTHVDAIMTVSGANSVLHNLRFTANLDNIKILLTLTATSDGTVVKNCEFRDTAADKDFLKGIDIAAAADGITLSGNDFRTTVAAGGNNAINSAAVTDLNIVNNVIFGKFASGAILTTGVLTRTVIANNMIINAEAAIAIALSGTTSTGILAGNFLTGTTSQAAALTGDNAMFCFENYINDTAGTSGLLNPAVDS